MTRPVTRQQRAILDALIETHPRAATHSYILRAMYPHEADEPDCSRIVLKVHVHHLRKRLPDNAIRVLWGEGYQLAEHAIAAAAELAATRDARDVEAGDE